jgi:N-methylhydantoinase A
VSEAVNRFVVAIDIGGTCTDCVVLDADGTATVAKAFSTPPDFSRGILDVLEIAAGELDTSREELLRSTWLFLHSTTVAENAIVDGTLAPAGLITTKGFADTLAATRGGFGRWSGLTEEEKRNPIHTQKMPPLIDRSRIEAVEERVDRSGTAVVALADDEAGRAVDKLLEHDIDAIGVSLLWSFVNPDHEIALRKAIHARNPDVFVTLSHELAPVVGEYERTSTVALNARLGPVVRNYLGNLLDGLTDNGFAGKLLVMQAHGGLLSVKDAAERPVGMIESGPVSGLMGCKRIGALIGFKDIISADVGGTTFKVGAVRDGRIEYQHESQVLRYHYALPKMDIESLGVAGGSVIWFDERTGTPRVGPRGAGSYPGPICYGHGGTEPTVTDVDAILGFMNADYFLGGREGLQIDKARAAFEEQVADRLGLPVLEAAGAIYKLANSYIYDLLHRTTVQRGFDPRKFVMFSTGGTAGMHLPTVAGDLGVSRVIIPHAASVFGAFGLVTSDIVHEELLARPMRNPDPAVLEEIFEGLSAKVLQQLEGDSLSGEDVEVTRSVDIHYRRQVHEVTVPLRGNGAVDADALVNLRDDFEALYRERYGEQSTLPGAEIELVTFRVRGSGSVAQPDLRQLDEGSPDPRGAVVEEREIYLPAAGGQITVSCYDLERLQPGAEVSGPAVVWSPITTVVLPDGYRARVDGYRNLVMERVGQ